MKPLNIVALVVADVIVSKLKTEVAAVGTIQQRDRCALQSPAAHKVSALLAVVIEMPLMLRQEFVVSVVAEQEAI